MQYLSFQISNRSLVSSLTTLSAFLLLLNFPVAMMVGSEMSERWWHPPSNEQAWAQLPKASVGNGRPLPEWARLLAEPLPRTTAALLELDYAHRVTSPLPAKLRAAMRFVCAQSNGCIYAQQAATADGKLAGANVAQWNSLSTRELTGWSPAEQLAIEFARQMSLASNDITDELFHRLVQQHGERQVASMVLLTAYANMQDRMLICLAASPEADERNGCLMAVEIDFQNEAFSQVQNEPASLLDKGQVDSLTSGLEYKDPNWSGIHFDDLQQRLEDQRQKPTRLRIPDWNEFAAILPADLFPEPSDIVWYRIAFGYAHELAIPFERVMRSVGTETQGYYDRVFGTSLFWVVTRAMQCSYCMGHCEMNWEVAGLSKASIEERSRKLASNRWDEFSLPEQHAFEFARKLSQSPTSITDQDVQLLRADFGNRLALGIAVQVSRYHYMTRISNGFQLRLEKENVFFDYWKKIRQQEQIALSASVQPAEKAFVDIPSDADTWSLLPELASGIQQPLPNYVKAVATQLPRTAAAMLVLDAAHRRHSPLPNQLRAKMRWVIADANRCLYSQATALHDLRQAGADDDVVARLIGNRALWPAEEVAALQFAYDLTLNAPAITDAQFEQLRENFGERIVAGMVLLAAYANFQDRIVLGLNVPLESQGPLDPVDVQFVAGALQVAPVMPSDQGVAEYLNPGRQLIADDPLWRSVTYQNLQNRLSEQRNRQSRLPIPTWDEVKKSLPDEMAQSPTAIRWSLVNYGYAPELAIPWTIATRTHWSECPSGRIIEESLFWVQTRALNCNYCMGHCEMLLQVAGLEKNEIANRTKLLAESDWSAFPPTEQRAYAFAKKLTREPWTASRQDYQALVDDYGPQQAMGLFWWLCRGLYMTRISDGFQLPLEEQNVFRGLAPIQKPE